MRLPQSFQTRWQLWDHPCRLGNWGGLYICKSKKRKYRSSALQRFPAFRQRLADPFLCDRGRYCDGGGGAFNKEKFCSLGGIGALSITGIATYIMAWFFKSVIADCANIRRQGGPRRSVLPFYGDTLRGRGRHSRGTVRASALPPEMVSTP